jgi:hypothetical protein
MLPGKVGPWARPNTLCKSYTGWACGDADLPVATSSAKQPDPLQNNQRRWPGCSRCKVWLHRGAAARGVGGGARSGLGGCGLADRRAGGLVGGEMPAAASSSARLRAALEGSKDRRMGRQACRAIQNRLAALAQVSGTEHGAAAEAGEAWPGGGPQAACWLSQVLMSSGPWKSSKASRRASSALSGRA